MSARERLEQHSLFLQKVAYQLLMDEGIHLAHVGSLVGDKGIFDRDMSTLLTLLFLHNNLAPQIPDKEKPGIILEQIASDLTDRGFYLPSFVRRMEHIKSVSNGSFQNPEAKGGGEAGALDRPLRSLREKLYEVRVSEADHLKDDGNNNITKRTGKETTALVEDLIRSIKQLETDGIPYAFDYQGERATKRQTEFLDARYDELGSKLNSAVGSTAEGQKISLLHLHPAHRDDMGDRSYAVADDDLARLTEALSSVRADRWKPSTVLNSLSSLLPHLPEDASDRQKGEREAEIAALSEVSTKSSVEGDPIVRVVILPFAPDQIDDNFPTLSLHDDEYIGQNVSRTVIESINRLRFAGFVDFDQDYRMMVMWANAADDSELANDGRTYRDLLIRLFGVYKKKFSSLLGMEPEIHKTPSGASFYFPKPIGIPHLVENFTGLQNLINEINSNIEKMEMAKGIDRAYNKEINDEELPAFMESSG